MILYVLGLELTLLVTASLALEVWQRRLSGAGRLEFLLVCACAAAWCGGDLLLLRDVIDEPLSDRIKYAGVLGLGPAWFAFTGKAAKSTLSRRVPWFPLLLALPGLSAWLLWWSDRYGTLFMRTEVGGEDAYGPLWLFAIVFSQGLAVTGSAQLAATAIRWRRRGQLLRRMAVALAPLVPLIGNALYITRGGSWAADPTPLLMVATMLALRSAIFRGGMFEPLPLTQREILHQIPIGLVVTDASDAIVELNDVAAARLGTFEAQALGVRLADVEGDARLERTPLDHYGRYTGELVVVR